MSALPHRHQTQSLTAGCVLSSALFMGLLSLSGSASSALAQVSPDNLRPPPLVGKTTTRHTAPSVVASASHVEAKPYWNDLNPEQQKSLKPLSLKWNILSESQKRKWLVLSKNYPSLPPAEQAKLHSRMSEWVSLSPQQRAQARLNFAKTKELSASEKASTWQAYQALSPEEKQKLAAKAPRKPSGVATAVKPTPPEKLTVVPVSPKTATQPQKLAGSTHSLDLRTLLPQQLVDSEPATVEKH